MVFHAISFMLVVKTKAVKNLKIPEQMSKNKRLKLM